MLLKCCKSTQHVTFCDMLWLKINCSKSKKIKLLQHSRLVSTYSLDHGTIVLHINLVAVPRASYVGGKWRPSMCYCYCALLFHIWCVCHSLSVAAQLFFPLLVPLASSIGDLLTSSVLQTPYLDALLEESVYFVNRWCWSIDGVGTHR